MSKLRQWMWPKPYKSYDGYHGPVSQWAGRITLSVMVAMFVFILLGSARACFP